MVAKEQDLMGYQLLVFKNLETPCPFGHNFCMLTVFPNWEARVPDIGEVGYVNYQEIHAGDTYYDRTNDSIMRYNFDNLVFYKFVKEVDSSKKDIII